MIYYDRYTGGSLQSVSRLPSRMDLGRFATVDEALGICDLRNAEVAKQGDYVVRETLFAETNQNIWDLLRTIALSYERNPGATQPIIQEFNTEVTPFERLLNDLLCHLRAIVASPHSSLNKNVMKVNIGRAKRLSTRSYQYIAHHSEDWEKLSVLSPKPRRILHEELIVDFAVYENILLKAFLQEAIIYLGRRVKETADLTKFFLTIFDEDQYGDRVWGEKIDRREALVGRAMKTDESKASSETHRLLVDLKTELIKLANAPLFEGFSKRIVDSVVFHDSNVLNSHKHYKYLKVLWLEQKKLRVTYEGENPILAHQKIMDNMRVYVTSLFYYALCVLGYKCQFTSSRGLEANHESLVPIKIEVDKYGVLIISTQRACFRVVSLGGIYDRMETESMLRKDTVCFCYGDYQQGDDSGRSIYYVNPIDPDSIECSGQVIRRLILREYHEALSETYEFKHVLRDFLPSIGCERLELNLKDFRYGFGSEMPDAIDAKSVVVRLRERPNFQKRNRYEQSSLIEDMEALIADVEKKREELGRLLVCPKCGARRSLKSLRYLRHWTCSSCEFVCDITGGEEQALHHNEIRGKYAQISPEGWGMDLIQ